MISTVAAITRKIGQCGERHTINLMTAQELRILAIEDNPNWVTKTVQILRLLGYRNVETAELLKDGVGVSA